MYYQNGLVITPNVLAEGDVASVVYKGILKNSGADEVFMHVGFGEQWTDIKDIKMKKTEDGFETVLPITTDMPLKLAFHDSANNWDNNQTRDYTFEVLPKNRV